MYYQFCGSLTEHSVLILIHSTNVSKGYFAFSQTATSVNHSGIITQSSAVKCCDRINRCEGNVFDMNGIVAAHINSLSGTFLVTDLRPLCVALSPCYVYCFRVLLCSLSVLSLTCVTVSRHTEQPPQRALALLRSSRETPVREESEGHAAVSPHRRGHSSSHVAIYGLHPSSWHGVSLSHTHTYTHTYYHTGRLQSAWNSC